MLKKTHKAMGLTLSSFFNWQCRTSFVKGCGQPDNGIVWIFFMHTFENTYDYIYKKIKSLIEDDLTDEEFAFNVGVVVHFIGDYFSKYHQSNKSHRKILPHVLHEIKTGNDWVPFTRTKEFENADRRVRKSFYTPHISDMHVGYFMTFLGKRIRSYNLSNKTNKDFVYAYETSYIFIRSILYIRNWRRKNE